MLCAVCGVRCVCDVGGICVMSGVCVMYCWVYCVRGAFAMCCVVCDMCYVGC